MKVVVFDPSAYLAEVASALHSTLDRYEETIKRIASLVVPRLADWCIVDLQGQPVAVAHKDPDCETWLWRLRELHPQQPPADGRPLTFNDLSDVDYQACARSDEELDLLRKLHARSAMVLPLHARNRTLGTISFVLSRPGGRYTPKDLALAQALCESAALAVDNARLYREEREARAEAERAHRGALFLSQASALLDGSLDYEATLSNVAKLAVSSLADWCAIHVVEEDGTLHRLAAAHTDRSKSIVLREYSLRYPHSMRPFDVASVLKEGRARLYAEVSGLDLAEDERTLLDRLGFRSVMIVPIRARRQKLGVIKFVSGNPERRYSANDLAVAENLAYRAALAIDNARLYRLAQQAIRAREQFLSIVSHELRTPVTPLKLQLQTLRRALQKRAKADPARLQELLALAERQSDRLVDLTNRLLEVGRISSGRLKLEKETADLAELVRIVTERFESSTIDRVAPAKATGEWDRLWIEQVIENLLSNAVKFGKNKPIAVHVTTDQESVRLVVRDQGVGIAPADLKRIFQPFERAVSSKIYSGLGLGLYIVKQIVEAHGGSVEASSVPGKGSEFVVTLPRRGRA